MVITPLNTTKAQYLFANEYPNICKHPGIIGGFGSGKTRSIPLRWLSLIDWRAKNQKVKCKMMIVEPTKEMIRDVLVDSLDEFFDYHRISHAYHKTNHNYTIRLRKNDKYHYFTAMLRSSDVPESLTGKNLTDFIIDEFDKKHSIQKQKDVWKECISRIRKVEFGTGAVVTTPEGFKYTYELFGECDYKEKHNFKLIRAKTYENQFLPKDFIENLYEQYSKELVLQYIEAQFINILQGKVYYTFNRDKHVKPVKLNKSLDLYFTFDFNYNPMTTSICQIRNGWSTNEQKQVVDVIACVNTKQSNTDKQCKELKDWLINNDYAGNLIITGDASKVHSIESNLTNWEIVKYHFPNSEFKVKSSNPAVVDRVNSVNSKMLNSLDKIGVNINNTGCEALIKDFEQVSYLEASRDIDKSNPDLTHNSDNFGYLVWEYFPLQPKRISKQW